MKRVLFITAFPPSDIAAAEKNTKAMLEELCNDFLVDLVYFKDADVKEYSQDSDHLRVLRIIPNSFFFRVKNAILKFWLHPLFAVRYEKRIKNWLQRMVDSIDYHAIIFDHSQVFIYAKKLHFKGIKVLLSHDVEAQRIQRSSSFFMYKLCLKTEYNMLSTPGVTLFTLNQKDVDLIQSLYGLRANLTLVYIDERIKAVSVDHITNNFVMLGAWRRPDNYNGALWLLNGIAPYLSSPILVNIIGKDFPIKDLHVDKNKVVINYLGFVDNPYEIIAESKAMLCPLFTGAGIKVKVIESLACGTPVIGTDIAFEGFSSDFEAFMLRCNNLESFSKMMDIIPQEIEERKKFKNYFIERYTSLSIPQWLKSSLAQNSTID